MSPQDNHTAEITPERDPALSPIDPALSLTHTLREAARHGERAVLLCSFQKEESVLIDELLRLDYVDEVPPSQAVRIVTIDTGVLFPETLQAWRAFEERFGVKIEVQDASCTRGAVERPGALLLKREGRRPGKLARRRRGLDHRHPPRAGSDASEDGADRTRRAARPVEVQPAGALDRQGPVAANQRARSTLQPAARPGL